MQGGDILTVTYQLCFMDIKHDWHSFKAETQPFSIVKGVAQSGLSLVTNQEHKSK